jgi:alpha-ketoglutarate-dependent taurine dioxygenase
MKPLIEIPCEDSPEFFARIRDTIHEHTCMVLTGGAADGDHASYYKRLAEAIGHFHYKDENPDTAQLDRVGWLDMRYDPARAAEHPYRYGNGRMGLHVDGSYSDVDFDVIFFYCQRPADFGGATTVIDGTAVVDYLRAFDEPLLIEILDTPVIFDKSGRNRTDHIIGIEAGVPRFNWNATRVSSANPPAVIAMAARFDAFCEQRLVDGGVVDSCRLQEGDALFLHNRLTLHGRCSFFGPRWLNKGAISLIPESARAASQ